MSIQPLFGESFSNPNEVKFEGERLSLIKQGSFSFSNFVVYGTLSRSYMLFMSPMIIKSSNLFEDYLSKNEIVYNGKYAYYFPIIISGCLYGQILKKIQDDPIIYYCENCPSGTFSINQYDPCSLCPFGGNCSGGLLDVYPGFWRIKKNVYPCTLSFSCL